MKTNIHAQSGTFKAIIFAAIVASTPAFAVVTRTAVHYNTQVVTPSVGLPAAKWTSFGRPSLTFDTISFGGTDWVGFVGSLRYDAGGTAAGIFDGPINAPVKYLLAGSVPSTTQAPEVVYTLPRFTRITDPVFGNPVMDGNPVTPPITRAPWASKIAVKPAILMPSGAYSSLGVWAGIGEKHRQVALSGEVVTPSANFTVAPSVTPSFTPNVGANTKVQSFTNLQMTPNGTLFYTAKLNDNGTIKDSLWRYQFNLPDYNNFAINPATKSLLVIAVGEIVTPDPIHFPVLWGTVTAIYSLGDTGNLTDITPSHGRVDATNNSIPIRYQFMTTNGQSYDVVAEVSPSGVVTTRLMTGCGTLAYPYGPFWDRAESFIGPDLAASAKIASTLTLNVTPISIPWVTPLSKFRVLDTNPLSSFRAKSNDIAPLFNGLPSLYRYTGFSSTVSGYAQAPRVSVAFRASTNAPASLGNAGIYSNANPTLTMREVAHLLGLPPGLPITTHYSKFLWLSHMDGKGPLFEASYAGSSSGYGLWGCDPTTWGLGGDAQLLVQNGVSTVPNISKTIASFDCLSKVTGSIGQRRAWTYRLNGPQVRPVLMRAKFVPVVGSTITTGIVTATY